jgi:hypothetical protein
MRASYLCSALAGVAMTSLACGSSGSPTADGGAGVGGDAPVSTGGTGGSGGVGGTGGSGGVGGTGGTGGTGGMNIFDCYTPGATTDTCSKTERQTLDSCYTNKCGTAYNTCYGAGARMGNFGGSCKGFIQCLSACGCGNVVCFAGCLPMYTGECMTCQTAIQTCQDTSGCVVPACAVRPDGGVSMLPDGGFPGLPDGGFPGLPDGGFPGLPDGGLGGTCANLLTCCQAITDPGTQAACMGQYTSSVPYGDAVCGALYQGYKALGQCP